MSNWIVVENENVGTDRWRLTKPAPTDVATNTRAVAGYLSASSANQGDTLTLYAHSTTGACTFEVFRMGWYGGVGGRSVYRPVQVAPAIQPDPLEDVGDMVECPWAPSALIQIGGDWTTGTYLVKIEAIGDPSDPVTGSQSYVPFVVRDPSRTGGMVVQCCVNTYQAYNFYGGRNVYTGINPQGNEDPTYRSSAVSFNRPYLENYGASEYMWEYPMVRWLEREGYPIVYTTSIDTHFDVAELLRHRAWISIGHDEYYSYEMRANLETAFRSGVCLAIIGGNPIFWQVRLEPGQNGRARRMFCYKYGATHLGLEDPFIGKYDERVTARWRDLSRPEQEFIGVQYEGWFDITQTPYAFPLVVDAANHWAFWGTGLSNGDGIPGTVGVEYDRVFAGIPTPPESILLARSPVVADTDSGNMQQTEADAAITADLDTRAKVFAAGSIIFSWRLEDPSIADIDGREWILAGPGAFPVSSQLANMTRNLLDHFQAGPMALMSLSATSPTPVLDFQSSWRDQTDLRGLVPTEYHVTCADILGLGADQLVFLGIVDARESDHLAIYLIDGDNITLRYSQARLHGARPLEGFADPTDKMLSGRFLGGDHDQLLLLNTSTNSGDGLTVVDFATDVRSPQAVLYSAQGAGYDLVNGILAAGELIVGDFAGSGYDQLLATTRVAGGPPTINLVRFVADPAEPVVLIGGGTVALFDGWFDVADRALVGDFLGLGHPQLALLNTSTDAGDGLMLADFDVAAGWTQQHYESYADSALRRGVRSPQDLVAAGDFLGTGHDQVLAISRGDRSVEPSVALFDLSGASTFSLIYQCSWAQASVLNGWRNCAVARVARRRGGSTRVALLLS